MASQFGDVSSNNQAQTIANSSSKHRGVSHRGLPPPKQVSLNAETVTASTSCPDSPIRRVSSSLRSSAVSLATRFFRKCRAATFTLDGATYTIGNYKLFSQLIELTEICLQFLSNNGNLFIIGSSSYLLTLSYSRQKVQVKL